MKIKADHFEKMKESMMITINNNPNLLEEYNKMNLSGKRYRWDILRASTIEGDAGIYWLCSNLYSYLNDEHIDTALRNITNTV